MQSEEFTKIQKQLNFSNTEMANILGITRGAVIQWKSGKSKLSNGSAKHIKLIHFLKINYINIFNEYIKNKR